VALVVAPVVVAVLLADGEVILTISTNAGIIGLIFEIRGRLSMTSGARDLVKKFGSNLAVAEAFILGELNAYEQVFASEVVDGITLQVAKIRLKALGKLGPVDIKPAYNAEAEQEKQEGR